MNTTISHRDRDIWGGTVEARLGDQLVGHLDYASDGFVENVDVKPEYQRKGVATQMLHYLEALGVQPSFGDGNTPAGDAWIKATGYNY